MILTLIGYRGSGKSTIAPLLSQALGWEWLDADVVLEARAGRSIREIFADSGEAEFRRLERQGICEHLQRSQLVLATGGGAILNPDTRREMRAAGPVVWLKADAETLHTRITADHTTAERRPQLTATGGAAEISHLLAVREPLYRETASIVIETRGLTAAQIAAEILSRLPADFSQADAG